MINLIYALSFIRKIDCYYDINSFYLLMSNTGDENCTKYPDYIVDRAAC